MQEYHSTSQGYEAVKKGLHEYRVVLLSGCAMSILLSFIFLSSVRSTPSASFLPSNSCFNPAQRREWRTLSKSEQKAYIAGVTCLTKSPSILGLNGSYHDDFALVHDMIGDYTHEAAPFLPWHRYYIHIYEQTLQSHCGYDGFLPYWDWTLDWRDLANAPIWDVEHGFGGTGNASDIVTVGNGHCVIDGPFAGLEVKYYNHEYRPHCLSRDFLQGDLLEKFYASRIRPEAMEDVFEESYYFSYLLRMEDGPHSAIPISVRGDFSKFTAPNDPVFFLHHAQIDQLWWKWQQKDLPRRLGEYSGRSRTGSDEEASLSDLLEMEGLGPDIAVQQMMSTESGSLCYRY